MQVPILYPLTKTKTNRSGALALPLTAKLRIGVGANNFSGVEKTRRKGVKMMARRWAGVRRPVEELALRRAERKKDAPPQWWRKWNELDGGEWARERADEDEKARRLLGVFFMTNGDDETEKARRLARALGLLDGGER